MFYPKFPDDNLLIFGHPAKAGSLKCVKKLPSNEDTAKAVETKGPRKLHALSSAFF
jgi:hypothetical protein